MDINKINLLGAGLAVFIIAICISIFVVRLNNLPKVEYWLGVLFLLSAIPLIYMIFTANQFQRPAIYYIQIGIIIGFILTEFFLDYVFKVDFRNIRWITITYVMLFFASTGGMIGIASLAGKAWSITAIILFLLMAVLAFYQRSKTGM